MKIEHIAIFVNDLEAVKHFFVKYFNATANELYKNEAKKFSSYFLTFENETRLELMHMDSVIVPINELDRLGYHHIAFRVGSNEKVDELTNTLVADGYTINLPARTTGDGYYESSVIAIENLMIEITV